MLFPGLLNETQYDRSLFIENGRKAGFFEWITSKGTNYTCYQEYINSLTPESIVDKKIEIIRVIIYAIQKPFTFLYFYWTILVFILHKFNFKKPIMRLILYHFVLRATGDLLDKLGGLYEYYFTNDYIKDGDVIVGVRCKYTDWHPFNWFLTREICSILWYVGEMVGDWYPLLRTRAVVRNSKSIWAVYVTCIIFNLTKVALIVLHLSRSPTEMFDKMGSYDYDAGLHFYNKYYIIQLIINYASFLYDITVYIVLKRSIFTKTHSKEGFFKKFKNLSEYRMLVSALVCSIFLPIISINIFMKFYYQKVYNYKSLNFDFEDTRRMVSSVQYYMIFIDQILLSRYKSGSSANSYNYNNSSSGYNRTYPSKLNHQLSTTNDTIGNDEMNTNDNYYYNNQDYANLNYQKVANIDMNSSNNNLSSRYYYNLMNN
jgi:hypothetical protein